MLKYGEEVNTEREKQEEEEGELLAVLHKQCENPEYRLLVEACLSVHRNSSPKFSWLNEYGFVLIKATLLSILKQQQQLEGGEAKDERYEDMEICIDRPDIYAS